MWAVVRDGRIASNGRHQLQSEHIQEENRQKGEREKIQSQKGENVYFKLVDIFWT